MNTTEMLRQIAESLGSAATVRSVFGEPIHGEGKTVVPIAKIAFGFGGGGGEKPRERGGVSVEEPSAGGGGGGGVRAFPAGVLEITHGGTRFIPYPDHRWAIGALLLSTCLAGFLFARRR